MIHRRFNASVSTNVKNTFHELKNNNKKVRRKSKNRFHYRISESIYMITLGTLAIIILLLFCLIWYKKNAVPKEQDIFLLKHEHEHEHKHEQNHRHRNGHGEKPKRKRKIILPFNEKYTVPGSHPEFGNRSDEYVLFRKQYHESVERNSKRSLEATEKLHISHHEAFPIGSFNSTDGDDQTSNAGDYYDIYNCPEYPPKGYPYAWNILRVLENWPTDDVLPRGTIHQGLCVFDYRYDTDKALKYRKAEVPFIVKNDPDVAETVERWNTPGYIGKLLGDTKHETEYSTSNHFIYSAGVGGSKKEAKRRGLKIPENYQEPLKDIMMSYKEWLDHANKTNVRPNAPHWYFKLHSCQSRNIFPCEENPVDSLFDELPFFQPKENLYMVEPDYQKGFPCRFGMEGVTAINHFDHNRNMVAVLSGSRRYILAHPNQCKNMALYPRTHPSRRHSEIDWSNPDIEKFPQFKNARANELIMQAGDVLYLPSFWFHFIVSLELTIQCNSRSGKTENYLPIVEKCGA